MIKISSPIDIELEYMYSGFRFHHLENVYTHT